MKLSFIRSRSQTDLPDSSPTGDTSKRKGEELDFFEWANRVLVVLCAGVVVYILFRILSAPSESTGPGLRKKKENGEMIVKEFSTPARKSFDSYQTEITRRDIFRSLWEENQPAQELGPPPEVTLPPPAVEVFQAPPLEGQLKVTGIVLGDVPEAIVEDLQSRETLFLKRGEKVAEAVVEEIQRDKVIFWYNNQRVELAP